MSVFVSVDTKSSTNDNEPEAGEVPDAPKALHRTSSIFFRHLAMQTTKEDLENVIEFYRFSFHITLYVSILVM